MRIARQIEPGRVHHVISRFVDRGWEFRSDTERATYLRRLGLALAASDWKCLAYALMSNHVHLAVVAGTSPLEHWLKRAHAPFANWMNKRHDRLGALFADRPAVWVVRAPDEARLIAYIHLNPVRAKVVTTPARSRWTSHRHYLAAAAPAWLDVADGLRRCGVAKTAFDAWTTALAPSLSLPDLAGARRAAYRFGAIELGTPTTSPTEVPFVARPFARVRPGPLSVLNATAEALRIDASKFSSRPNAPELVRARQIFVRAAAQAGLTFAEAAAALGLTRQSGSRLAARMLDRDGCAAVVAIAREVTYVTPSPGKRSRSRGNGGPER